MRGQNVMADISALSQSFHFGLCLCILIDPQSLLGLQPQQQPSQSPVTPSSEHLTKTKVATLDLLIRPLQLGKSPRRIVASTTLNNMQCHGSYTSKLATPIVPSHFPPHCFTLYPTPVIRDNQHSVYNEPKLSPYPCYIPPQTPACTFDALNLFPRHFL